MPKTQKKKTARTESVYGVHPGVYMVMKWVRELKEKTGRTLEEWQKHIVKNGPDELRPRIAWLKEKYNIGSNTAWWLAERADGQPTWDESEEAYLAIAPKYVEEMFAGKKAPLLPLYHKFLELGRALGDDVKFCPCKTIVPLYRKHVFAQVKPTTNTRIDFGLALGDTKAKGRLIDTGGFKKKDRITHRFAIAKMEDIDDEVEHWLRIAYDRDD
jgi:Domain of unknown function (DUF5655)/Domain of unknown function (DUF4287)